MANGRYRPRKQFKFWLYTDLQNEHWLIDVITYWKSKRQFSDIVKSGLRLMFSLGQGHTDVLFELFPQLESQLAAKYAPPPAPDTTNLEREIAELKQMIREQGRALPDGRDGGFPLMMPATKGLPAAPTVNVTAAKPASADEIADAFLAFLQ